ncbi:efflux RND transporter periplasmic adaptor subunit [Sphingomonas oligophenolica]|uniref:Efflux RND transporter periplasmic adaptor subunit n=1 Tax=Sphingomonas oligophenolica TaxID=301154 RepID=A0ABU9Y6P5_9SPHN
MRPTPRTYEYVTQAVDRGEVVRRVTASGKLRALNTIKVGAEVSGQITRVLVDFNSPVTKGQVLAEIDPTRLRARVQQSRAQVALAQASLAQAEASISRAHSDAGTQERDYRRRASLAKSGFISTAGLDTSANALAASRAGARTAAAQAASARAQIAQAQAELSSAELDLSRSTIVAPASGVVINKLVEPGTTVAASFQTPNLFEIAADTTRMQVEASVDEADIGQVRGGQPVRFTVDAYPGETFAATVRQIRKSATELQNVVSYLVILDVDNKDGKLLPGMTANVEIITGERPNVVRVPATALRFRPRATDRPGERDLPTTTPVVYIATTDEFRPQRRIVTLGLQGEDYVEIVNGIAPGDKLIIRSRSTIKKKAFEDVDDASDNASGS